MDAALDDARALLRHADRARRAVRSASPPAARTTTRTCSGRRCSRRSTATMPPEDPLRGVARQIDATARLKAAFPDVAFVGSALQLPAGVAAARRRSMPSATASPTSSASAGSCSRIRSCRPTCWPGAPLQRKFICRTFSDCTTGPRLGLVSGLLSARPALRRYTRSPTHPRRAHGRRGAGAPPDRHHAHRRREGHHLRARPQLRDAQAGHRRRRLRPGGRDAERPRTRSPRTCPSTSRRCSSAATPGGSKTPGSPSTRAPTGVAAR